MADDQNPAGVEPEIPEPNDPSSPLWGRTAEERKAIVRGDPFFPPRYPGAIPHPVPPTEEE